MKAGFLRAMAIAALTLALAGAAAAQRDTIRVEPIPGAGAQADDAEGEEAMLPGRMAVLQTLDKISARISTLEVPVGETVAWERLEISVAKCSFSSPFERPERAALLRITEQRRGLAPVEVFAGWMFASSPALHAMEHPIYDVLVTDCLEAPREGAANGENSD